MDRITGAIIAFFLALMLIARGVVVIIYKADWFGIIFGVVRGRAVRVYGILLLIAGLGFICFGLWLIFRTAI